MGQDHAPSADRSLDLLIEVLHPLRVSGTANPIVQGVQHDSRRVRPGEVFFAISGLHTDGAQHIGEALSRGACAIVSDQTFDLSVPAIQVSNARLGLGQAAAWFHNYPSRNLKLVGVSGTNGKTTTCYLIKAILERAGEKIGLIGTIANYIGSEKLTSHYTTPDPVELFQLLEKMVSAGVTRTVMEVSSHALAQDRVSSCRFDTVIFTNLSHDHLDFHQNLGNYKIAKAKLFQTLLDEQHRKIINQDDEFGRELIATSADAARITTYGLNSHADLHADNLELTSTGTDFTLHLGPLERRIRLPLFGRFNVYNALAAITFGLVSNIPFDLIVEALEQFPGIPGRLQPIDCGQPFQVFVDYAHTPDGLEQVLQTLRDLCRGRLLTVFGCTGDRDRTKRPMMGEIAARYSDFICITSDDPHNENPATILQEIEKGVLQAGKYSGRDYLLESDRFKAIKAALDLAAPGDIVLIAGKGHETVQIFAERALPFSDAAAVLKILQTR